MHKLLTSAFAVLGLFGRESAQSRTPVSGGCYTISDRATCCQHIDGRSNYIGNECVPAAPLVNFTSGRICEPACWTQGSCHTGLQQGTRIGSCPKAHVYISRCSDCYCYPEAVRIAFGKQVTLSACQDVCDGDSQCAYVNYYPGNTCYGCPLTGWQPGTSQHGGAIYRKVAHAWIDHGACMNPVKSLSDCVSAARGLGSIVTYIGTSNTASEPPYCYAKQTCGWTSCSWHLMYNSGGHGECKSDQKCLCMVTQESCSPKLCEFGLVCINSPNTCCSSATDWSCCGTGSAKWTSRLACPWTQNLMRTMCGNGMCVDDASKCSSRGGVLKSPSLPCTNYSCCSAGGADCLACVPQWQRTSNCHCETCNPGFFNPTATGCQQCIGGSVRRRLAGGSTACTECPDGRYGTGSSDDCGVCDGSARRRRASTCTDCPPGYYIEVSSNESCVACTGSVRRRRASTCTTCSSGFLDAGNFDDCQVTPTTIRTTTTAVTRMAPEVIDGRLALTVANASDFVLEPHVESVMQIAIANLSCVNTTWVEGVNVTLVSERRLGANSLGAEHDMKERWLSLSSLAFKVGTVMIEFQIFFPPGGGTTVLVTQTVDKINSMSLAQASLAINKVLKSGMFGQPYDVTVIRMGAKLRQPVPAPPPAKTDSADSGSMGLIILILGCCIAIAAIFAIAALWALRKQLPWIDSMARKYSSRNQKDTTPDISSTVSLLDAHCEGSLNSFSMERLLFPPEKISKFEGERIRKFIRAVIDYKHHRSLVYLTYAMGQRSHDAPEVGPGMYYAAAVTKKLYDSGIECCSDLVLPPGAHPDVFNAKISLDESIRVLIVVQTKALYECRNALKQIYTAQQRNIVIFPLRFGNDLPSKADEWPFVKSDDLNSVLMLSEVQDRFGRLNCLPSPPYTVMEQKQVLEEVVTDIKKKIPEVPLLVPAAGHTKSSSQSTQKSRARSSIEGAVTCKSNVSSLPSQAASAKSEGAVDEPARKSAGGKPPSANDDQSPSVSKGTSDATADSERFNCPATGTMTGQSAEDRPKKKVKQKDGAGSVMKKETTAAAGRLQQPPGKKYRGEIPVATIGKRLDLDMEQMATPRTPRSLATTPRSLGTEQKKSPRPMTRPAPDKRRSAPAKPKTPGTRCRDEKPSYTSEISTPKRKVGNRKKGKFSNPE